MGLSLTQENVSNMICFDQLDEQLDEIHLVDDDFRLRTYEIYSHHFLDDDLAEIQEEDEGVVREEEKTLNMIYTSISKQVFLDEKIRLSSIEGCSVITVSEMEDQVRRRATHVMGEDR